MDYLDRPGVTTVMKKSRGCLAMRGEMSGPPLLDPDMQPFRLPRNNMPFRLPMNKDHYVFVCAA